MSNLAAAYAYQMLCGNTATHEIVNYDLVGYDIFADTVEEDNGHAIINESLQVRSSYGILRYRYHKTIDARVEERLYVTHLAFRVFVGLAYHGVVSSGESNIINATDDS